MEKPVTLDGYDAKHTVDCERVLVTLLRGLGPWKDSVYLVGGLTPRYLVRDVPPGGRAHAGTLDVDIVVDVEMVMDTDAYRTLEQNLRRLKFRRAANEKGQKLSWRWETRTEHEALVILELLTDAPHIAGGRVQPLPTDGAISALNIPHSSIVFDLYQVIEIQAELLDGNGFATEQVKHASLVSFTCLKALAFDQRFERKDAYDLIYCIEHAPGGPDAAAESFRGALESSHGAVIQDTLRILRRCFVRDDMTEGYRKDGPVSVAKFEVGEGTDPEEREARLLRQRQASDVVEQLLAKIG